MMNLKNLWTNIMKKKKLEENKSQCSTANIDVTQLDQINGKHAMFYFILFKEKFNINLL